MHLLLTDRLACPRCGPAFGLILLAERMQDRRVFAGTLGCPNCRDSFGISGGFADLRAPPRGELGPGLAGAPPPEAGSAAEVGDVDRLRALLGLVRGPGTVALVGGPARLGTALAGAVPDLDVVAVDADMRAWPDTEGLSRIVSAPGLPFFSGVLRGVVIDGALGEAWWAEAARVAAPKTRIVVAGAHADCSEALERRGLTVLAAEGETVVATRG